MSRMSRLIPHPAPSPHHPGMRVHISYVFLVLSTISDGMANLSNGLPSLHSALSSKLATTPAMRVPTRHASTT